MRAWIEINLKNLIYNLNILKKLSPGSKIMPVIKADAYGMGAHRVVEELSEHGIEIFAVATMEEAVELRSLGVKTELLVLGGVYYEDLTKAEKLNIQVTLNSWEQIKKIQEKKLKLKIHLAVETGMGRVGFSPEDAADIIKKLKMSKTPEIVGVYSHFSVADEEREESKIFTLKQIERFRKFSESGLEYIHLLNSGGIYNFHDYFKGTHIRPGIALYGVLGDKKIEGMQTVFKLKTRVLFIKTLTEKTDISYGRTAAGEAGDMIATLSIGYADGFKRALSNRGHVLIAGVKCPIIGRVCMDMCMVKIPKELEKTVRVGMEVLCIGENIVEMAELTNCTTYEILTGMGKRLPRIYI